MVRLVRKSLVVGLWLVLAALVSLAQPVAVSASHLQVQTIEMASTDHAGHVHQGDQRHNPADHAHDVGPGVLFAGLAIIGWPESWNPEAGALQSSLARSAYERPPRATVTA